jgi:hypothetical protein
MHQDQVVPALQQELVEILPVAAGRFQADADLGRWAAQVCEVGREAGKARRRVDDREWGADGGFVGPQEADGAGVTSNINPNDVLWGRRKRPWWTSRGVPWSSSSNR